MVDPVHKGWFCPWVVFNVTFLGGRNRVKSLLFLFLSMLLAFDVLTYTFFLLPAFFELNVIIEGGFIFFSPPWSTIWLIQKLLFGDPDVLSEISSSSSLKNLHTRPSLYSWKRRDENAAASLRPEESSMKIVTTALPKVTCEKRPITFFTRTWHAHPRRPQKGETPAHPPLSKWRNRLPRLSRYSWIFHQPKFLTVRK